MPTVDFATFNKKIDANELKGIFRGAWQMDYPSIENFLTPIYAKGAWPPGSNWGRYDNPEFDALLAKAAAAPTTGRGQRPVPAGRGHAGRGLPDRSAVVLHDDVGLVGPGHRRARSTPSACSTSPPSR